MGERKNFTKETEGKAFKRQAGRCALCGKALYVGGLGGAEWQSHHANGNKSDDRLGNCVLLCKEPCHLEAHKGNFGGGETVGHHEYLFRNAGDARQR